jgi:hypothetical protein
MNFEKNSFKVLDFKDNYFINLQAALILINALVRELLK